MAEIENVQNAEGRISFNKTWIMFAFEKKKLNKKKKL